MIHKLIIGHDAVNDAKRLLQHRYIAAAFDLAPSIPNAVRVVSWPNDEASIEFAAMLISSSWGHYVVHDDIGASLLIGGNLISL